MQCRDWNFEQDGALSVEAIRRRLDHPGRYRVSSQRFPPGARFAGTARAGSFYVLSGACRYTAGDEAVEVAAGQGCETPEGEYELAVAGDEAVEVVRVWALPEAFWG